MKFSIEYTKDGQAHVISPEAGTFSVIFAAYNNDILTSTEFIPVTFTEPGEHVVTPLNFSTVGADSVRGYAVEFNRYDETVMCGGYQ